METCKWESNKKLRLGYGTVSIGNMEDIRYKMDVN